MNILGIDFGLSRIGTAVGSAETGIAFARQTLKNSPELWDKLGALIQKENIQKMVIGNPKKSHPDQLSILEEIEKFTRIFQEMFPDITWEYADERFTSLMAKKKLYAARENLKKNKHRIDAVSAQIILQSHLDAL